jgi:hypothetical protein
MPKDYVVGNCEATLTPPSCTINLIQSKQPFCCPVCGGNGLVPNGFYLQVGKTWSSSDATPEKCKSCHGTGIVWD